MFGKKNESQIPEQLLRKSVEPASLDPNAFAYDAQVAADCLLRAIYSQSIPSLPMNKMEESFFAKVKNNLTNDLVYCRRMLQYFNIEGLQYSDYDNVQTYAVKSLSYDVTFTAQGTYQDCYGSIPFSERRRVTITFINDSRMGWIMSSFKNRPVF